MQWTVVSNCLRTSEELDWNRSIVSFKTSRKPLIRMFFSIQPGPSPLLQAWLTFALEPQRASRKKGLQGGASPLLLPGHLHHKQKRAEDTKHSLNLGSSGSLDLELGSFLPSDAVLSQSEFLEPLSEDTRKLYQEILHSV